MVEQLKGFLKRGEAALIMSEVNISYFTSFHSSNGYLLVTADKSFFLTDSRYIEAAQEEIKTVDEVLALRSMKTDLYDLIDSLNVKKLHIEVHRISVGKYNEIKKSTALRQKIIADGKLDKAIDAIRIKKDETQKNKIIEAQRIAERAFDHILSFISTEKTEREIALELDYFMLKSGADALSFETIAVSGKNSSKPHGVPSDKKIEKGDFITMDFGAVVDFYHSDMTRTVAVGEVSSKQIEVYETVLKAQHKAIEAIKSGKVCKDIDKIARDVIKDKGYGNKKISTTNHTRKGFCNISKNSFSF